MALAIPWLFRAPRMPIGSAHRTHEEISLVAISHNPNLTSSFLIRVCAVEVSSLADAQTAHIASITEHEGPSPEATTSHFVISSPYCMYPLVTKFPLFALIVLQQMEQKHVDGSTGVLSWTWWSAIPRSWKSPHQLCVNVTADYLTSVLASRVGKPG